VHLRAHGRVQAIGRNQQRARHLPPLAVAGLDECGHAFGIILPVAHHALAQLHGVVAQALPHGVEQHHLQLPPVHRILGPVVARLQPAWLGVHLVAVATHQRPFARLQANRVQHLVAKPQVVQFSHGVGLQVDAHAQRLQLGHCFKDDAGHADLVQGEGSGHATDAAASDQHGAEGGCVGGSGCTGHAGIVHAMAGGVCREGRRGAVGCGRVFAAGSDGSAGGCDVAVSLAAECGCMRNVGQERPEAAGETGLSTFKLGSDHSRGVTLAPRRQDVTGVGVGQARSALERPREWLGLTVLQPLA